MCGRLRVLSDVVLKYGPAYFISMHVLSICCFWVLFFGLRAAGFDLLPFMRDTDVGMWCLSFLNDDAIVLLESGGTFAAALLLNRLLTPVRLAVVLVTLPYTATYLNNRWVGLKARCCGAARAPGTGSGTGHDTSSSLNVPVVSSASAVAGPGASGAVTSGATF